MTDEAIFIVIAAVTTGVISSLTLQIGYHYGKAAGIRESRHILDEQRRDYEKFRDAVFSALGIEVD